MSAARETGCSDAPLTPAQALEQRLTYGPMTQQEQDQFLAMCQRHGVPPLFLDPTFEDVRVRYYKLNKEQRGSAYRQATRWLAEMPLGFFVNAHFTIRQLLEEALTLIESGKQI